MHPHSDNYIHVCIEKDDDGVVEICEIHMMMLSYSSTRYASTFKKLHSHMPANLMLWSCMQIESGVWGGVGGWDYTSCSHKGFAQSPCPILAISEPRQIIHIKNKSLLRYTFAFECLQLQLVRTHLKRGSHVCTYRAKETRNCTRRYISRSKSLEQHTTL